MKKCILVLFASVFSTGGLYSDNSTFGSDYILSRFVMLSVSCLVVLVILSICIIMIMYSSIKRKNRIILGLMERLKGVEEPLGFLDDDVRQEVQELCNQVSTSVSVNISRQSEYADEELFRQFDEQVQKERFYLNYNLGRDDYARMMGVDKNRFGYIIKEYGGGNLSSYLNNLRLDYSVRLLCAYPEMAINEIATQSAFPNSSTYYRLFREKYGKSPNLYRSQCCCSNAKMSVERSAIA